MTTESQIMDGVNPWEPAKNYEDALRLFRLIPAIAARGSYMSEYIRHGWTIQSLMTAGYIEAVPALPASDDSYEARSSTDAVLSYGGVEPSKITQALVAQIYERDAHGRAKYGVSLDRGDLSIDDWLQHMAEEMMDGAGYALAAKREFRRELIRLVEMAEHGCIANERGFSSDDARRGWLDGIRALADHMRRELSK